MARRAPTYPCPDCHRPMTTLCRYTTGRLLVCQEKKCDSRGSRYWSCEQQTLSRGLGAKNVGCGQLIRSYQQPQYCPHCHTVLWISSPPPPPSEMKKMADRIRKNWPDMK